MRDVLRRTGWVLILVLGIPVLVFGVFTLHTFFAVPFVLLLGFTAARSDIRIFLSGGMLVGIAFLLAAGIVIYADRDNWWSAGLFAASALAAIVATFKIGMMINLRSPGRKASDKSQRLIS